VQAAFADQRARAASAADQFDHPDAPLVRQFGERELAPHSSKWRLLVDGFCFVAGDQAIEFQRSH
jgi:hypothetical protein